MTRDLDQTSSEQVRAGLVELGVPNGLAGVLAEEDRRIGLRIYLLDNSGSMNQCDGCVFTACPGAALRKSSCTRWEEICAFARDHARWNLATGIPAEFMILNSGQVGGEPREGVDYVRVESSRGGSMDALELLLRNNPPRGGTPITRRLQEIALMIQGEATELAQRSQMVFLTLATDGLPSSIDGRPDKENMIHEIKRMANSLPVQMVIRLCTDDADVVQFYNKIDEEYELPLDIIDDFESEAREIAAIGNDFFTYTAVIHRIREAGTLCKLMDSMDEVRFSAPEVRRFVELLSNDTVLGQCVDNKAFVREVRDLVSQRPRVYDPVTGQMRAYVNVRSIQKSLRVGFCVNLLPFL